MAEVGENTGTLILVDLLPVVSILFSKTNTSSWTGSVQEQNAAFPQSNIKRRAKCIQLQMHTSFHQFLNPSSARTNFYVTTWWGCCCYANIPKSLMFICNHSCCHCVERLTKLENISCRTKTKLPTTGSVDYLWSNQAMISGMRHRRVFPNTCLEGKV